MVVVDADLCVKAVLLQSLVVLVIIFNIGDGRCFEVHRQREGEDVFVVGLQSAVAVVLVTDQSDGVLGVVGKVIVHGVELDLDVGRVDAAAIAIGLANIGVDGLEYDLTGGVICDGDLNLRSSAEHTCPHEAQGVDRTLPVRQRNVVAVCRDHHILGILQEVIRTQIADIVLRQSADGTACVGIGHDLVFRIDGIVELISIGLIVVLVEHGCLGPVSVERKVGNAQIHTVAILGSQSDEALHIHAVCKGIVQIFLVGIAQGDGNLHIHTAVGIDRQRVTLDTAVAAGGCDHNRRITERNCLLGNSGIACVGLGVADTLSQHKAAELIGQGAVTEVGDREL